MRLEVSGSIRYLITEGEATDRNVGRVGREICEIIRQAVTAEIALVQIREKNLSALALYNLAYDAAVITRGTRTRLLINDRTDISVAAGADGVHLTTRSIPIGAVRRISPADFLIGVSTHSFSEMEAARSEGADFAVYGPVFETPGKSEAKGLSDLADVCRRAAGFPVIALGGMNAENLDSAIEAGAAGAAAIRWLNDQPGTRAD